MVMDVEEAAFPIRQAAYISYGLTKRDYFAGQALAGLTAKISLEDWRYRDLAAMCYLVADAMLSEREKG
jgi:hypothetical protein